MKLNMKKQYIYSIIKYIPMQLHLNGKMERLFNLQQFCTSLNYNFIYRLFACVLIKTTFSKKLATKFSQIVLTYLLRYKKLFAYTFLNVYAKGK